MNDIEVNTLMLESSLKCLDFYLENEDFNRAIEARYLLKDCLNVVEPTLIEWSLNNGTVREKGFINDLLFASKTMIDITPNVIRKSMKVVNEN